MFQIDLLRIEAYGIDILDEGQPFLFPLHPNWETTTWPYSFQPRAPRDRPKVPPSSTSFSLHNGCPTNPERTELPKQALSKGMIPLPFLWFPQQVQLATRPEFLDARFYEGPSQTRPHISARHFCCLSSKLQRTFSLTWGPVHWEQLLQKTRWNKHELHKSIKIRGNFLKD